jgi:tetratricopeptide (TPR) repeat protein
MARERLTKKEIREIKKDWLAVSSAKAWNAVRRWKKATSIVLILVIASAVGLWWTFRHAKEKEMEAAYAISSAMELYSKKEEVTPGSIIVKKKGEREENLRKALSGFQDVARRYKGTKSGTDAIYFIGACQYELGMYKEALESYRRYLSKKPKGILAPMAAEAIGYIYERNGEYGKAVEAYKDAASKYERSFLGPKLYLDLGRAYELIGDKEKARESYNKVLEISPNSSWAQEAEIRANMLGRRGG